MSTETTYPAAGFTATRDELLGDDLLLGSAEIARGVCSRADRSISVLSITPERMRRVDGWLGAVGFVTHAAAVDPGRARFGSVCDRDRAGHMVALVVESLVGTLPAEPAGMGPTIPVVGRLSPSTLPPGINWVTIVSAWSATGRVVTNRVVVASVGGLSLGELSRIDGPVSLSPADGTMFRNRLAELLDARPRSVLDSLADD
jgi:hypothetical protein